MQIVTVIGAGTMGHGIAHVVALAGYRARLVDANADALLKARAAISSNLTKGVEKGKLTDAAAQSALARLTTHTDLSDACVGADLVIEAVPEDLALKQRLLAQAEAAMGPAGILASNTSSLSIDAIAAALARPDRLVGMHFFNPVHLMELLELVRGPRTDEAVVEAARAFGVTLGKEVIVVRDVPGFASSRLGVALGMEAIRMVEQGVASPEDIDKAMVLGYRHPVGPLKLTDMVGLDVRMAIGTYLASALGNPAFEPPELMRQMVAEGKLGKKSGRGFYGW